MSFLKKSKGGKSYVLKIEMLKNGINSVVEWLVFVGEAARYHAQDWQDSCLVSIYSEKVKKCSSYSGVSLFSVVLYVKLTININRKSQKLIGEEQCDFKDEKDCMDQAKTYSRKKIIFSIILLSLKLLKILVEYGWR